jgi:hypothetical protein
MTIRHIAGPALVLAALFLPLAAPALGETGAGTLPTLPDLPETEPLGLGGNVACDRPAEVGLSHLPPALLLLTVTAPCRADEPVRVTHGALAFAGVLDAKGRFHATVPALADPAELSVSVGDDVPVTARHPVPDMAGVTRLALSTRGAPGLHLAADLPAGAALPARRIDGQAPGLPSLAQGGFLTRLGDPALPGARLAEVLTLSAPSTLSLVAEVTADTCGRDLLATLAFAAPGQSAATGAISLSLPGCDAVGERLVVADADLRRHLAGTVAP